MNPSETEHYSISQLKAFQRNPFYYALAYLFKLPQPESEALVYGKKFHSYVEALLQGKSIEDADLQLLSKAEKLVQLLEESHILSSKNPVVEELFFIKLADDLLPFKGFIDLSYITEDLPYVLDHKTIGNPRYALKSDDLKVDLQLCLYAYYKGGTEKGAHVQHNQIFKGSDEIRLVSQFLTVDDIYLAINKIIDLGRQIKDFTAIVLQNGIYSYEVLKMRKCDSCLFAYGGCPYKKICQGKMTIEEYQKEFEKMNEYTVTTGTIPTNVETPKTWAQVNLKLADLADMMFYAREKAKDLEGNKFEQRDTIARWIAEAIKKYDLDGVIISQVLMNGNDPDYMPVINRIKEYGGKLFVEIK